MKFAIASVLLAAGSALAAPLTARAESTMIIGDLVARASSASRTSRIEFTLSDRTNGETIATDCELIWGPNGGPREDVCENDNYLVRFVNSSPNINDYTLEVERVDDGTKGRAQFKTGTESRYYECINQPATVTCVINFGVTLQAVEA